MPRATKTACEAEYAADEHQEKKAASASATTATTVTDKSQETPLSNATTTSTSRHRSAPTRRSANDFRFGKMIGEGSFSTVFLAKDVHTGKECASEYFGIVGGSTSYLV